MHTYSLLFLLRTRCVGGYLEARQVELVASRRPEPGVELAVLAARGAHEVALLGARRGDASVGGPQGALEPGHPVGAQQQTRTNQGDYACS